MAANRQTKDIALLLDDVCEAAGLRFVDEGDRWETFVGELHSLIHRFYGENPDFDEDEDFVPDEDDEEEEEDESETLGSDSEEEDMELAQD